MKQYSEEFKAAMIAKMLPPHNVSVPELASQTGIPKDILYAWRIKNRKSIVGWEVFDTESADHAASLIRKTYLREGIVGEPLVLHSDNGSPMKGATMLVTLHKLGVIPSFSRPSVSNDNAYIVTMGFAALIRGTVSALGLAMRL